MKPSARLALFSALGLGGLVALLLAAPRFLATPDVRFEGRPVEDWIQALHSGDRSSSNAAAAMTDRVVLPGLLDIVRHDTQDSGIRVWLVEQLDSLPGIHVEFLPADGRRVQAIRDLGKLGPAARSAVPALIEFLSLKDEQLIGPTAEALVAVQADATVAIPALTQALLRPDGHGRPEVAEALGEYGSKARDAVPMLLKLLNDFSSKEIRTAVPKALRAIDPAAASRAGIR